DARDEGDGDGDLARLTAPLLQQRGEPRAASLDLFRRGVRGRDPAVAELGHEPEQGVGAAAEPDRRAPLLAARPHAGALDRVEIARLPDDLALEQAAHEL